MSVSVRVPADPPSSYRAIENLIVTYAELVDDGDFAGLGTLLADATFTGSSAPVSGPDAIEKLLQLVSDLLERLAHHGRAARRCAGAGRYLADIHGQQAAALPARARPPA